MAKRKNRNGKLSGGYLFFISFILCCPGSAVFALTVYRLGGADLPEPVAEGVEFKQLSWGDVSEKQLGSAEALEIQPGFIAPEYIDPELSLTPPMGSGFTLLSGGEWRRPEALPGWYTQRFAVHILDGDEQTFYSANHNEVFLFDLGRQVYLERIRFFTRQFSNRIIPRFILGSNDGDQRKDGTRLYAAEEYGFSKKKERFDFNVLYDGSGSRIVDLKLPPTPTRRLLFQVFAQGVWEMVDFEIFGRGYVPYSRYTSSVIDLGEKFNLGPLLWAGQEGEDTRVVLRMRSGDDEDPNTYWRRTFRGNEQVPYNAAGTPLTRTQYQRLELTELGDITHDFDNWDAWSSAYDFAALQGPSTADRPRRFVQFDIAFHSTSERGDSLDFVQFAASPPLVTAVRAEITPAEAAADEVTNFIYKLRPQLEPGDPGFDGIIIETPALVDTLTGVESVRLGGEPLDFEIMRIDVRGFALKLNSPIDLERTEELLEIGFRAQVFAYDTPFDGYLFASASPGEVAQSVLEGDADEGVESNTLRVALDQIPQASIQAMRLSSPVFSPNGDGVNDVVRIDYELLNLRGAAPVAIGAYDLAGRRVARLVGDEGGSSGLAHTLWDGRNAQGLLVPPGLYSLQLEVEADSGAERSQLLVALVY